VGKKRRTILVRGGESQEDVANKARELLAFRQLGWLNEQMESELEEIVKSAGKPSGLSRIQSHRVRILEQTIQGPENLRWKLYQANILLKRKSEELEDRREIRGKGILVDGVEWKSPWKFKTEYQIKCPRRILGDRPLTIQECLNHKCVCLPQMKATTILDSIVEALDRENGSEEQPAESS